VTDLPIGRWDRESAAYRRFREHASDRDAVIDPVRREWASFLRSAHGDALARNDVDPAALFLDCCYHEFVVGRLAARAAAALGVELVDPDGAGTGTDLRDRLGGLAERLGRGAGLSSVGSALDRETLLGAEVADLRRLYEAVVPREGRLALGEYHTPPGVAALAVSALTDAQGAEAGEQRPTDDWLTDATVLDPGCGSGVFLAVTLDRKRRLLVERGVPPRAQLDRLTDTVFGIDLNPVAVTSARLAYLLTLAPVLQRVEASELTLPVVVGDSVGLTDATPSLPGTRGVPTVDALVGNPPWLTWDRLPDDVQARWRREVIDRLDLFPREGQQALLGHGNDDLGVAFVFACLDRYLDATAGRDARASVVLKRDLLTGSAGKAFRSLRVGDRDLRLTGVHDFAGLSPFGRQVRADAAIYALRFADGGTDSAGEQPAAASLPVPATAWSPRAGSDDSAGPAGTGARVEHAGTDPRFDSPSALRGSLSRTDTELVAVDPAAPTGAWVRADAERSALGECAHTIRHGVKDDAKAVYALDREQLADLEPDHVFPYLKSRHVVKFGLFGHDLQLVPLRRMGTDNEAALRADCPRTYDYLAAHRETLTSRASSWLDRGPFYTLFGLGEYTWADYKVVWCRLGFKPHFAVVSTREDPDLDEKPVVPGDHCMFVATDSESEAHFLCALLNSAPYQHTLRSIASNGKSSLSKSVVSELRLPAWAGTAVQERLAELSMDAHAIVPGYVDRSKRSYNAATIPELAAVQSEIDSLVATWLAES
jgi:hypothetical protein